MYNTITFRLSGDDNLSVDGFELNTRSNSPVCTAARQLIELGVDPNTIVVVLRGNTLVFKKAKLSMWANMTVAEGSKSARFIKFREIDPEVMKQYSKRRKTHVGK